MKMYKNPMLFVSRQFWGKLCQLMPEFVCNILLLFHLAVLSVSC